jgi:hypothetical protein
LTHPFPHRPPAPSTPRSPPAIDLLAKSTLVFEHTDPMKAEPRCLEKYEAIANEEFEEDIVFESERSGLARERFFSKSYLYTV